MNFEHGPDYEALLKENLRLTRENNKLLRKMRRAHLIDVWSRIFLFLIIIGVPFFFYRYYLEDYMDQFVASYEQFRSDVEGLREIPGTLFRKE